MTMLPTFIIQWQTEISAQIENAPMSKTMNNWLMDEQLNN